MGVARIGRSTKARKALLRSLVRNLYQKGKIETSVVRAKALLAFVGRLRRVIGKADLSSRRRLASFLGGDHNLVEKVIKTSGKIRVARLTSRVGDASPRARVEFVKVETKETVDNSKNIPA